MNRTHFLSATLLTALLLSACGNGSANLSAVAPTTVKTAASDKVTDSASLALEPIKLAPINADTVKTQASLRKDSKAAPKTTSRVKTADEVSQIEKLLAEAESKIQEEDKAHAAQLKAKTNSSFSTKSAQGGKDIDIELFLYHPKYGAEAKKSGIKTAYDFLQAGRSPWRRWTLKLKLEGLFAPKGFNQQILFWVEQADLLRVSGISKDQAWLLVANGITSVPDLGRRNVIELGALFISLKAQAFQYGMDAPSFDELKAWTEEARGMQPVIY